MSSAMHGGDRRGPRAAALGLLTVVAIAGTLAVGTAACGGDQREMRAPSVDQTTTSLIRGTTTTVYVATTVPPTTATTVAP